MQKKQRSEKGHAKRLFAIECRTSGRFGTAVEHLILSKGTQLQIRLWKYDNIPLKHEIHPNYLLKNLLLRPVKQRTSFKKINYSTLFRETTAVYSKNHTKHINQFQAKSKFTEC
jgi:hypothetical protein